MPLLGPMYHLQVAAERQRALADGRRIVRPGGLLFIAAISRWAARLNGVLNEQLYIDRPEIIDFLPHIEPTAVVAPRHHASFTGYCHRADQFAEEVGAADLDRVEVVASTRALEHVPELLGYRPHMLAIAHRPTTAD